MIRVSKAIQVSIIILACMAPFLFPSVISACLAFSAALIFPPLAIVLGILTDLLYQPAHYWPMASLVGLLLCVVAVMVRSFVKTRIM
jgi:hypothetical protein